MSSGPWLVLVSQVVLLFTVDLCVVVPTTESRVLNSAVIAKLFISSFDSFALSVCLMQLSFTQLLHLMASFHKGLYQVGTSMHGFCD